MEQKALDKRNTKIANSLKQTRAKRATQDCTVLTLKIQSNKLSRSQQEALNRVFLEAKWVRNAIIASGNINKYDTKLKTVPVKLPDGTVESRELKHLGSHVKQSVLTQVQNDVKGLSILKANGRRIGALKFAREVNSVDLKQCGVTYRLKGTTRVKIQGIPGELKYRGNEQFDSDMDFANAKLIRKPSGYYLRVTCFKDKNKNTQSYQSGSMIGLDMGVKTHVTLSNGEKVNTLIGETERLKRLQRKLSKQVKGSNNYRKTLTKIKQQYELMSNRKNDSANKLVHDLLQHERVFMQDEMISNWVRRDGYVRAGKRLHHSILGRVKAILARHDRVTVLSRSVPTTQACECGVRNKHGLSDRVYTCGSCGYSMDRDVHAALNMVRFGLSLP